MVKKLTFVHLFYLDVLESAAVNVLSVHNVIKDVDAWLFPYINKLACGSHIVWIFFLFFPYSKSE